MSYLDQGKKAQPKPPIITIVASPGAGKSSLAALFPNPVFIQGEDASTVFENWDEDVQPLLLPVIPNAQKDRVSSKAVVMDQLRELATAEHDFKTVVIDTITNLNIKFEKEIAIRDDVTNVADASGGYHKGYLEVASWHSDLIYACEVLRARKGMAIVFLAHSGVEKIKNRPDEASEYAVYGIDMYKKSAQLYTSQSDAVFYIKKEEYIQGTQTNKKGQTTKYGRAMQTGDRVLITSGDGLVGYVSAKNRYGMPVEIPLPQGENPILQHIKFFNKEV